MEKGPDIGREADTW